MQIVIITPTALTIGVVVTTLRQWHALTSNSIIVLLQITAHMIPLPTVILVILAMGTGGAMHTHEKLVV